MGVGRVEPYIAEHVPTAFGCRDLRRTRAHTTARRKASMKSLHDDVPTHASSPSLRMAA